MILIGFDPSLTATGYAVLRDTNKKVRDRFDPEHGELIAAGRIVPDGESKDYPARLRSLALEAKALIDEHEATIVVAELPSTHGHNSGSKSGTYHTGQPIYGSAVGAVLAVACLPGNLSTVLAIVPPRVLAYAVDVWTRSLPREVMRTRDDPDKTRRVQHAAHLYRLNPEDFGAKSNAGDVADAVLLARYALLRVKSDAQVELWKANG